MSENKSVKLAFDCAGGDFERAGEASSKIKKMLQRLGIPADCVRRIAIGTYEAEMNVIIHAGGGNGACLICKNAPMNSIFNLRLALALPLS